MASTFNELYAQVKSMLGTSMSNPSPFEAPSNDHDHDHDHDNNNQTHNSADDQRVFENHQNVRPILQMR